MAGIPHEASFVRMEGGTYSLVSVLRSFSVQKVICGPRKLTGETKKQQNVPKCGPGKKAKKKIVHTISIQNASWLYNAASIEQKTSLIQHASTLPSPVHEFAKKNRRYAYTLPDRKGPTNPGSYLGNSRDQMMSRPREQLCFRMCTVPFFAMHRPPIGRPLSHFSLFVL